MKRPKCKTHNTPMDIAFDKESGTFFWICDYRLREDKRRSDKEFRVTWRGLDKCEKDDLLEELSL